MKARFIFLACWLCVLVFYAQAVLRFGGDVWSDGH
jgi:hypothetical protein